VDDRERDLVYAGGFFDGEGSIYFAKSRNRTGTTNIFLTVSLVNTDLPIMEWFAALMGGKCESGRETREGRKPIWRVRWQSAAARRVLQVLMPYLRVKHAQAQEALAFEAARRFAPGQHPRMSAEESARRMEFHRAWQARYGQPKGDSLPLVTVPVVDQV